MIAYLSGFIIVRDDPLIILDVNGVGYRVHGASDVLSAVSLGLKISIFVYTRVREDALELYGFLKYSDLKLFESLLNVSGVGPRTAISIFSNGSGDEITKAIIDADVAFFSDVPRLGTKNAQKIIIELKNKVGGAELDLSGQGRETRGELTSALKAFGFSSREISEAIKNIDAKGKSVEEQIKLALKYLGK